MNPAIIDIPLRDFRPCEVSQNGDPGMLEIRRPDGGPTILVLNPQVPVGGDWSFWVEGDTLRIKLDLPPDFP